MAGAPLQALLRAVDRSVRPLSPRDHLDIERWYRAAQPEQSHQLRAGLASIVALNETQWTETAGLVDQYLRGELDEQGFPGAVKLAPPASSQAGTAANPPQRNLSTEARPGGTKPRSRAVARLRRRVAAIPARGWAVALALLLAGLAALAFLWVQSNPPIERPTLPPSQFTRESPPEEENVQIVTRGLVEPSRTVTYTAPLFFDRASLLWLALVSFGCLALGARWIRLARRAPALAEEQALQADDEARTHRARLEREREEQGGGPLQLYEVTPYLPFEAACIEQSAALLGRAWDSVATSHLDVPGTLRETIRRGGRPRFVRERRAMAPGVVVLIDAEGGDHCFLPGMERVVDAWERLGVVVERFHFDRSLDRAVRDDLNTPRSLAELARRTANRPLLILSRALLVAERAGHLGPWTELLAAWPGVAWLDPDPLTAHSVVGQARIQALRGCGLKRFPWTGPGLVAAAQEAAGGAARGGEEATNPQLPEAGPRGDQALVQWIQLAARVPDPTWDQLEAIRREVPQLAKALPGPWAVRWLLDLVGDEERFPLNAGRGRHGRGVEAR